MVFLRSVKYLDLKTKQWFQVAPLITPRIDADTAVLGKKIYVSGGYPLDTAKISVECFDSATRIHLEPDMVWCQSRTSSSLSVDSAPLMEPITYTVS